MASNKIYKTSDLKILFWNARSINKRKEELPSLLKDIDIFICVESWLKDKNIENEKIIAPGFVQYKKNRTHSTGGGILIMVRKNIAYREIKKIKSPDQSVEVCGIILTNTKPSLDIIVSYRTPGNVLSQEHWHNIIQNINTNRPSILVGDFNAHNTIWNCSYTDKNGERLYESTDEANLYLHNHNTITRSDFHRNFHSNIDLLFSTQHLAANINVEAKEETFGSDHYPILCSINIEKCTYKRKSFKIHSVRTNWERVQLQLEVKYQEFFSAKYDTSTAREKYETFLEIITKAIAENTPIKKKVSAKKHNNPASWWDEECNKAKRLRRAALKKWRFTQDLVDLIAYKKAAAIATKLFKKKKRQDFKKFAATINFRKDSSYAWYKAKVLKNKWIKINLPHQTEHLQLQESINDAMNKITPPWVTSDPQDIPLCAENEFFSTPFDFVEFNMALESTNCSSAPGMDGIEYGTIKNYQ
ncbi:uncharacterized protein LOC131675415 [Phymastichus coffea]|uniref:uncharacterized protein LOC131675415 n=1 Tax=Phymastichus coffea TaxID=108790 RepID=UPI00273AC52E|nr:uncharacterized protein LOC131675415 [Phymastichus coffea]